MSLDKVNVVIVGGGVIGCSAAYYLARAGAQVTLLERGPLCSEASSANAGSASLSIREGYPFAVGQESLRMMAEVSQQFETDFEFEVVGSLVLLRTEKEYQERQAFVDRQQRAGVDIQIVDRKTAMEMEPAIRPDILGAVYSPIDCALSPYALTIAFGREARKLGATIRTWTEVMGLKAEGGRVRAALTGDGEVAGDIVVMAAGTWSPALTRTIGLDLPIVPARGQIMITEPLPTVTSRTVKNTGHIYVRHTPRGNYVIGSLTERVGFNKGLTTERMSEYLGEAEELIPSFKGVRVLRGWAGLRPLSTDGEPILGPVPGYEGLVLATGHSRSGVFYSAATSKMVADFITTGTSAFPLEPFSLERFRSAA